MASDGSAKTGENAWPFEWLVTNDVHSRVAAFFVERRDEIYGYLLSLGIRPAEAQEFTNDAFLKYYVALREGQSIHNPRAWVYAVAHNLALKHHSTLSERALPVEVFDAHAETPESIALERERFGQLRRAVENLSPQQRSCLHLRAEGFRYREIARILGPSPSTVGEFLQRAVKNIRKAIYGW